MTYLILIIMMAVFFLIYKFYKKTPEGSNAKLIKPKDKDVK